MIDKFCPRGQRRVTTSIQESREEGLSFCFPSVYRVLTENKADMEHTVLFLEMECHEILICFPLLIK